MKPKDIAIVTVALAIIIGSVIFIMQLMGPKTTKTQSKTEADKIKKVPKQSEIDTKTLEKIYILSDYGKPELEGIGKTDLFSN